MTLNEMYFEPRGLYYRMNDFREDRPTIVFMHGLSGHASAWKPFEKEFGDEYNILTFDIRGHGRSLKHAKVKDYTIPMFAEDLLELTQTLNIKKFILVTHSFGVLIALEFAKQHQKMLSGMVLLSPSYSVRNNKLAPIAKLFLETSRLLEFIPFTPHRGYHFDYTKHKDARDWNISMTFDDVRNTGLRTYFFASLTSFDVAYEDLLEHLKVPTLLIQGKKDSIFPIENSRIMSERMPNAERVVLEDGDHIIIVNTSYFPRIKNAMGSFLRRIDNGTSKVA